MNESDIPHVRSQLESAITSLGENITASRNTNTAHNEAIGYSKTVAEWFNGIATTDNNLQGSDAEMGRSLSHGAATEAMLGDIVQDVTNALSDVGVISEHHGRAATHTTHAEQITSYGRESLNDLTNSIRQMRSGIYANELSAQQASEYLSQANVTQHSVLTNAIGQVEGLIAQAEPYNDASREVIAPLAECQSTELPELHSRLSERVTELQIRILRLLLSKRTLLPHYICWKMDWLVFDRIMRQDGSLLRESELIVKRP